MTEMTQGGSRPVPDPTVLTTEALQREALALRELFVGRIESESKLRAKDVERIDRELQLGERQRVEQKADTKAAVDAALAAAKEAVKEQTTASGLSIAKSEHATNEQLKQLTQTFTTAIDGVNRTIDDAKDRVNKLEQNQATAIGQQRGASATIGYIVGAIGCLAGIAGVVAAFIALTAT